MSSKKKKKSEGSTRRRSERRFTPKSSYNPWLVRGVGALGAMLLGAGASGYFYGDAFELNEKLRAVPLYLVAAGFVATGAALWLGTSGEAPLRVGDPGIGQDRGEVRRMPWWAVEKIGFESRGLAISVVGADETGKAWTLLVPIAVHPEAASLIVREAEARVPEVLDVPTEVRERLATPSEYAGMLVKLEPLQVVGKHDAISGKPITYEPDARVCDRCERIYSRKTLPSTCACGQALGGRGSTEDETESEDVTG